MSYDLLFLSQQDVIDCGGTSMEDTISDLEKLYMIQSQGDYLLPDKVILKWPGENSEETRGRINGMACYLGGEFDTAGIKWIGSGPNNPFKYNLPRASALIVLNDPITMIPFAVMDGAIISAMRTGGVTGVCSKYLAPKNSKVLSLFGAGVQSRTQLMAILATNPSIETIRVYDYYPERSEAFAQTMGDRLGVDITPVVNRKKMFSDADILVTATTATEPLIYGAEIEKGCYIAHIGGMEVDVATLHKADKIVVDNWEISKHRGGDLLAKLAIEGVFNDSDIYASVDELVSKKKAPRSNDDEITYTSNVGLGTYDIALAVRIYKKAIELKKGQTLRLWDDPNWI